MNGNLEEGFFLMHSAYEEDVRTQGTEFPTTPAFSFVSLDYFNPLQFYGPLVRQLADYLRQFFNAYRQTRLSQFQINDFRNLFLSNPPNRDILFSFVFTLARLNQLNLISNNVLRSDFAGQYEISLLFDLVLVIEATVAHQNTNSNNEYFPQYMHFLSNRANLRIRQNDLQDVNVLMRNNFDQSLQELIYQIYDLPNGMRLTGLERDIAIAYSIRNRAAHNISTSRVIVFNFERILQSLLNVLFLSVDVLYR